MLNKIGLPRYGIPKYSEPAFQIPGAVSGGGGGGGGGGSPSVPEAYTIENYGIFPLGNIRQRLI